MSELQLFSFESKEIGTVMLEDECWWVATEVCKALEIPNVSTAINGVAKTNSKGVNYVSGGLDEDEKRTISITKGGRAYTVNVINESGLWSLVLRSRKEEAKRFKKWLTSEVIPSLRKTGSYSIPLTQINEAAQSAKSLALTFGLEGNQALLAANRVVKKQFNYDVLGELDIQLEAPDKQRHLTPTELGLLLEGKMGERYSAQVVNKRLMAMGLQHKIGAKWMLTEAGKAYGIVLDIGTWHGEGMNQQGIRWKESVIELFA